MSAQPSEEYRRVIRVPRTISGVRAALDSEQRAAFQTELESTELSKVGDLLDTWWTRAVVWSSPEAMAELDNARAGTWQGRPAAEVFGDRWTA
jgi:hypothetical protein